MLWVVRENAERVVDAVLRERANVEDPGVEVRTKELGSWDIAQIPAGSRDESGIVLPVMSVGSGELPPEGRVYVVDLA